MQALLPVDWTSHDPSAAAYPPENQAVSEADARPLIAESSEVSSRLAGNKAGPEPTGKLAGHAADVAALTKHTNSPLRPALRPPLAVQRSPVRVHRRQLSTVKEEVYIQDEAVPVPHARPDLPPLDLEPLMQQQVAYTGPQELYQSTAYTSDGTDLHTSATVSNLSEAAAHSNVYASQQQQQQQQQTADDAESTATDAEPLINFTPPPRQAVAKLAKVFQAGPSRLSNSSNNVAASKAWSPLKHHARAAQDAEAAENGPCSRLALEAGPRESHLDFFLRDAAAATANFRLATTCLLSKPQVLASTAVTESSLLTGLQMCV